MVHTTRSEQTRLRRLLWRADRPLTAADASSRITAFVYGNILTLAALIALSPEDLLGPKAIAYVLGTGLSTFLAHVVAESVGSRVHAQEGESHKVGRRRLQHHIWDAVPILSSSLTPAVLMAGVLLGWIHPTLGLLLAIGVTVLRVAALGLVVSRLRRERASLRSLLTGASLAVVCIFVAALKWLLTH